MDDIQDGNPAVIGKPLRPVALRPLLSKGVPLLKVRLGCCTRVRLSTYYGTLLVILCHPRVAPRNTVSSPCILSATPHAVAVRGVGDRANQRRRSGSDPVRPDAQPHDGPSGPPWTRAGPQSLPGPYRIPSRDRELRPPSAAVPQNADSSPCPRCRSWR